MPWIFLLSWTGAALAWALLRFQTMGLFWLPPCPLKQLTGIPCVSCGMTRCVAALSEGDLRQAFHWHPVGLFLLLMLPFLGVWDVLRALRGKPYPPLPEKAWARWAFAGALAGTWWLQVARGI